MPPRRKVPFSNKQKKEQLRAKRERKQRAQRENGNECLNNTHIHIQRAQRTANK